MAMPNMKLIDVFMTQLEMPQAFWAFVYKMAARGHFVFPIDAKNHRVLVIWDWGLYKHWRAAAAETETAETAAQPKT